MQSALWSYKRHRDGGTGDGTVSMGHHATIGDGDTIRGGTHSAWTMENDDGTERDNQDCNKEEVHV